MQYCSYSIGLYFHHQSHPQLGAVFILAQLFHSFWKYFPTVAYWVPTNLRISSFCVLSFCLFILFMGSQARVLKWFAIPFSSGPRFVRILHHDPSVLVALQGMAHSFIELDKISITF